MNAFLIFCKRHRAQVREKYPHLENRQVTKILGEWWADLPAHQKTSYTELARQYKEAFLRANPDFKWYKIPAQPPRPPPARPSNQKVPRCNPLPTDGAITFGKLADEAQMGGLSTLLSTASNSSGSSSSTSNTNSIGSGSSSLTTFTTAYVSAANTSAARSSPIGSSPSVTSLGTFTNANSTSISMSTNTIATTNLSSWSGTLQRLGPGPATAHDTTSTNTFYNGPKPNSANTAPVSPRVAVSATPPQVESATSMTPPKPPKKRYLHENLLQAQQTSTVPTPAHTPPDTDKQKACSSWTEHSQKNSIDDKIRLSSHWSQGPRQRVESGSLTDVGALEEQHRRVTNGCISTSSPHSISSVSSAEPGHHFEVSHSPLHGTNGPLYGHSTPPGQPHTPPPDDQPLNLSTETTLFASQQQLINNIVDKMCSAPNLNSGSGDNRLDVPRFFRPENLNNNNNEIEKPAFHKAIDARINGMCDVSLLVSKTIDFVIDRAYDEEKEKREKLLREDGKGPVMETKNNSSGNGPSPGELTATEEVQSDPAKTEAKESVSSSSNNISNSNTNGISNPNMRPRKRPKEDSTEETDATQKKRRDISSGRNSRANSRNGVGVAGGRSRAPRACKGKIYEELISEGVLPAPRRSRTRNSRWEEVESSTVQEQENGEQQEQRQKQQQEEENEEEHTEEDDAVHPKPPEEENGDSGVRRQEDVGRKGRRQLRRLHPDDFNLEARIEALPSLSLDEFTRRKKERKRTSSASSSTHVTSHSNSNSFQTPTAAQPTVGVVSSSSRVSAQADSTSDSSIPTSATSTSATATTSGTATTGGVSSSSNSGSAGGNVSDGEPAASPTPSSSSSSSINTQQHSPQGPILVSGGSVSPGEGLVASSDGGPLIGSQKRKARKQTITRHDPVHGPLRRDTSVVEQSVLTSMGLAALAEVALSQPIMKL
nr:serine-rich adhesin for platelets-like isoform X2 [Procambarus clarkii]